MSSLIVVQAIGQVAHGHNLASPGEYNCRVYYQGGNQVEEYAAKHDEEAPPYRFLVEIAFLWRLGGNVFGAFCLVHHAGNADISPQRQPADTVFRFIFLEIREQAGKPLVSGREQVEVGVEEQIELLHLHTREFGEEEVAAFVHEYQQTKAAYQL